MGAEPFPDLPLDAWRDTKETIHRFSQIVGKVRLAGASGANHWWDVPLAVTARGVGTGPIHDGDRVLQIDFDYREHRLHVDADGGGGVAFALTGLSVAAFYAELTAALDHLGSELAIARPRAFDLGDDPPFARDHAHASYDRDAVARYHRILLDVEGILHAFAARFAGKQSAVNHWWHTFDLALNRFSGRRAELPAGADPVTREAYSHEVSSSGFWFGDDAFPAPAFYAYTAPSPEGLTDAPLSGPATWETLRGSPLALLPYSEVRRAEDPRTVVLDFYESAYRAGAGAAGWDLAAFERGRD